MIVLMQVIILFIIVVEDMNVSVNVIQINILMKINIQYVHKMILVME